MKKEMEQTPPSLSKDAASAGSRKELKVLGCISLVLAAAGLFVSFNSKRFVISQEIFFPQMEKLRPLAQVAQPCNISNSMHASNLSVWMEPMELWHSMSDEELMWRASFVPHAREFPYQRTPKVAFMFLARGGLPLAPLWERFFKGHKGLYSIYIHSSPDYKDEMPKESVFHQRKIPSKAVQWGSWTMVDAERRLLANALLDFSNERFVLLSESCIPLFNFTTIYRYLMGSDLSFVSSFDDPRSMGRGRYNKRMWPTVGLHEWRKGSQWFEVSRKLAVEIVSDRTYFPVFREYCRPSCYVDEHYVPTLVTKLFPQLNSNRSITWVDWSRGGSHPATFARKHVSESFLNWIRHGSNCTYIGDHNTTVCFLFARKFGPSALEPLLKIAPALLGSDVS